MSITERIALPGNILDRILELERRTSWLEDNAAMPVADPESGDGAITYISIIKEGDTRFVMLDGSNQALWIPNPGGDATQDITGHFNLADATYQYKINDVHALSLAGLFGGIPNTRNVQIGPGTEEGGGNWAIKIGDGAGKAGYDSYSVNIGVGSVETNTVGLDNSNVVGALAFYQALETIDIEGSNVIGMSAARNAQGDVIHCDIMGYLAARFAGTDIGGLDGTGLYTSQLMGYSIASNAQFINDSSGYGALVWDNALSVVNSVAMGESAMEDIETSEGDVAIGFYSIGEAADTSYVTAVGTNSHGWVSGSYNFAGGAYALRGTSTAHTVTNMTAAGAYAGFTLADGMSGGVFLGYQAGYYETAPNKLFIDNAQRANEADARVKALVYGIFDAATANQYLTINGHLVALESLTVSGLATAEQLIARDQTVDTAVHWYGIEIDQIKTAGATNASDDFFGLKITAEMDQVGGTLRYLDGFANEVILTAGTVTNVDAWYSKGNLDGGTVTGSVYGGRVELDIEAGVTIGGHIYGHYIEVDTAADPGGNVYMLYLDETAGVDYGLYQNGSAPNVLGGSLTITSNDGLDLGAAGDADADLITVNVAGAPKLWWDEAPGRFVWTQPVQFSSDVIYTASFTLTVPATGTAALLNQSNSFTLINPLVTIAESWIGPSATAGVYFKGGNYGFGTATPGSIVDIHNPVISGGFTILAFSALNVASGYHVYADFRELIVDNPAGNEQGGIDIRVSHNGALTSMIYGRHDRVGIFTNGTERVRIIDSGYFGVNVINPDTRVEIYEVGTQLKLSGGAADYATFAVAADGAMTITTVDADAAMADITFNPDGQVNINAPLAVTGDVQFASWGESPFTALDGLLLLGPGCPMDATSWTTLRGQAATLSGAFHPVNGRWPGTRALMVEEAGLNYELAPRMIDDDASGVADGWSYFDNLGSGGSATTTVMVHPVAERGWMQRMEYTGVAGDVDDAVRIEDFTAAGSFLQGDSVTLSLDVKGALTGCTFNLFVHELDAGGISGTVHTSLDVPVSSNINRPELTFTTVDADCNRLRVRLFILDVDNGNEIDIYLGAINIEKLAYPTSFMAGSLPYCAWSGADDASTSTRAATEVNLDAYASLLSDNDTWSVSLWWQPQYDADADRSGQRDLFDVTSGAGANRCVIQYLDSDIYGVYINGDYRLTSAAQTFGAGDWQHVLLTSDFGTDEYFLYINGVEADSDTTALTASTGLVQMNLGTRFNNTEHSNAAHSQLAIFDSVLTAADAAAIYQAGNPLTDQGATQQPQEVAGMMRQDSTWHAYGGFEDQAETIACGAGDWNWITNGNPWNLWTCDEEDGISCALDVFTITNTGDYSGVLSLSISGLNGKDFHVRVYNNTQTRVEGRPIGISTTGAGNKMNVCLPIYIEATAGDEIQFEIMSADGTDPVVDDGLFHMAYIHD